MPDTTPEDFAGNGGVRQRRAYAFACDSCKRRKIKCGGERPICSGCLKYREECIYGTSKPASERPAASTRVKRRRSSSTDVTPSHRTFDSSAESPGLQHLATAATQISQARAAVIPTMATRPSPGLEQKRSLVMNQQTVLPPIDINMSATGMHAGMENGPSGSFSGFMRPPPPYPESIPCRPSQSGCNPSSSKCTPITPDTHTPNGSPRNYDKREQEMLSLRANAKQVRLWEVMAFRNLEQTGPEPSTAFHLLETYWCWQQPQYLTVYRPTFLRDMAAPGPYCNQFLLNMLYAQATPIAYPSGIPLTVTDMSGAPLKTTTADQFTDRAKLLLMAEMDKPTSIPTIQGLFILAGSECSRGNSSAGWLYAGMAYRMMQDLGIHLDDENHPNFQDLSLEEREIRRTLWWTAYSWDTTMSLVLARAPTWREHGHAPREFPLDDTSDDMIWTPYVAADGWAGVSDYPPYRSYGRTTFVWFCRLCRIVNEILCKRYVRKTATRIKSDDLNHIGRSLEEWWRDLPPCLRLDPHGLPEWCPPLHIFSLNLFYRAALILLHRPGCCSDVPGLNQKFRTICLVAADDIHQLLLMHGRTFAYRNLLYNISYCVCLAASVNVSELRNPDPIQRAASKTRLDIALHVLEVGKAKTPGISRCIDILRAYTASQGHPSQGTSSPARNIDLLAAPDLSRPPHLGPIDAPYINGFPPSANGVSGSMAQPPLPSMADLSQFNGQTDPLAALLTNGLDMPDGDLWNWLAFAEPT